MGLFLGFSFCIIGLCLFLCQYCFDYYSFIESSEIKESNSSSSIFLSQDYFGYSESFVSPYQIKKNFFVLVLFFKNAIGNLVGIALNL